MDEKKGQGGPATPEPTANGPARARWLIYSREHGQFWRPPLHDGYTPSLEEAGRYTTVEALQIVAGARRGLGARELPPELMLLAPECAPLALLLEALSESDQVALTAFLTTTQMEPEATTHGGLDLAKLVAMLLQDVALMIHRPGSWEGAGMRDLMAGHGYHHWQHDAICEAVRREYWKGKDPYAVGPYGAGGPRRAPRKP